MRGRSDERRAGETLGLSARPSRCWLTRRCVAYRIGPWLQRAAGGMPLVNPVLIAVAAAGGVCWRHRHVATRPISRARSSCISCWARRRWRWPCRCIGNWRRCAARAGADARGAAGRLGHGGGRRVGIAWALGAQPRDRCCRWRRKSVTTPVAMGIAEQHRRPAVADRGAGDADRHHRRDDRDAAAERCWA